MGTRYERNLPNNAYQAATSANNASANNPFATIDDISTSTGNLLLTGGASYSGTGLIYDVSALTYLLSGIEYATTPTQVTLNAGDPTFGRFDAIVADENQVVSILQGVPSVSPVTPAIGADQILVQYVSIGANATAPTITTEYIYREASPVDWSGGVTLPTFSPTLNTSATTPTPFAGSNCALATYTQWSSTRYVKFTAPANVLRADYAVLSIRVFLQDNLIGFDGAGLDRQLYCRLYDVTNTDFIGTVYLDQYGLNPSLVGSWQLVSIPINAFTANPAFTDIGVLRLYCQESLPGATLAPAIEIAYDDIKLQTGFGPSNNTSTIDILKNGNVVADTSKLNFIPGANTAIAVTEDVPNNKVDVEISSTGGSSLYTADGTIAVNRLVQIQNGLIWSGSTMFRTTNTRNIKEVIQESDLGSTLAANTTYVIRGKVTVSNSITVTNNGTEIVGLNRDVDEIEWAGTGNLFFVRDTNFTMANLKLSSSTAGNNIISALNVQGTGYNYERNKIITITNCQFRGTYDIMDIDGFDLVDISQCLFIYVKATNWGLRFRDTSKLQISSSELIRWFDETSLPTPSGFSTVSMIEFRANAIPGGFGAVNINGCIIHPQQNQNGIDIAAGSTTGFGTISSNAFVDGNLLGEVFLPVISPGLPNYSAVETIGYDVFANQGILNSTSGTVMTLTGNATVTALSAGVPAIINTNGSVVQQAGVRYTVTGAGRATYTGKKQVYVSIHASISYEKQGNGTDDYKFYIYKNGALLPGAEVDILVDDDASTALPMVYGTLMSTSDYIEFYVENPTGNEDMLVKDFQVVIRE